MTAAVALGVAAAFLALACAVRVGKWAYRRVTENFNALIDEMQRLSESDE